jgi:hypothetical protein
LLREKPFLDPLKAAAAQDLLRDGVDAVFIVVTTESFSGCRGADQNKGGELSLGSLTDKCCHDTARQNEQEEPLEAEMKVNSLCSGLRVDMFMGPQVE